LVISPISKSTEFPDAPKLGVMAQLGVTFGSVDAWLPPAQRPAPKLDDKPPLLTNETKAVLFTYSSPSGRLSLTIKFSAEPSGTVTTKRYLISSPIESERSDELVPEPASLVCANVVLTIDFSDVVNSTVTVAEFVA
jgi:hypothetical protein